MQDVSFTKAVILAKEALRCHKSKNYEEEETYKYVIIHFTRNAENWIKQVMPNELVYLQYLYLIWKDGGRKIFSEEEYDELFNSPRFKEYVRENRDYYFSKILVEDNAQNRENFFKDIV